MANKTELIVTDSLFNVFPLLCDKLDGKTGGIDGKNLIFCDEKVSLMTERMICDRFKGSFNTDVYSFGNFLRLRKKFDKLLSKEGSAMAVKRILSTADLKCFSASKVSLAPSLYELIIQLKSAKVTTDDILRASKECDGVLKNKLVDIAWVYSAYENFIKENGFEDQSSVLSYLPEIIENDCGIKDADVYLVGFTSWTSQARSIITALLKNAKSVTAILADGDNDMLYVGETALAFRSLCKQLKLDLSEQVVKSNYSKEGRILVDNIFNPTAFKDDQFKTDNVYWFNKRSSREELETVAETIKALVINGRCRYCDVSVALSEVAEYREDIRSVFGALDIPYFIDEKKKPDNHPLITLIVSYIDGFRKNMERSVIGAFYKNPLFNSDKAITDGFENYLIKYNVDYFKLKEPFSFETDLPETAIFEDLRVKVCKCFEKFDIRGLLRDLNVKEKLADASNVLKDLGEMEEASVNDQVYDAVIKLLDEMDMLLGETHLTLNEIKSIFLSGVSAMELSIIPQYNDAVFIGGYKEISLARPEYLFAIGLTDGVPSYKDDVSLLSDGDINRLTDINVLVEPKIKVVNQRTKESVGLALSTFKNKLFLSYPSAGKDGKKKNKSEIFYYAEKLFTLKKYEYKNSYLTKEQSLISFARECGEFSSGRRIDFSDATAFYASLKGDETVKRVLDAGRRQVKVKLDNERSLIKPITSPTTIEDYYKCPYRAFASHVLRLKDRETGLVDGLSVGNIVHEIFDLFVRSLDQIDSDEKFEEVFASVVEKVLSNQKYSRYLSDDESEYTLKTVLAEAKKHCANLRLQFENSLFKPTEIEKKFNIPLTPKVKLEGKVDRIDTYGDYYRVIDYKTGKVDGTDKELFSGTKLQLYLYAKAFEGKTLAGAYYMPINDDFVSPNDKHSCVTKGKTLNDIDAISAQDKQFKSTGKSKFMSAKMTAKGTVTSAVEGDVLSAYVSYAVKVSKKAAEQMADGVMVASPYSGSCKYCDYKGLCGRELSNERFIKSVDEAIICDSVKEADDEET